MRPLSIFASLILLAATAVGADAPPVDATLQQIDLAPDMYRFRGPVNVQYQLTISNPLVDETIRLTRISLRTQGRGAYSLRVDDPIDFIVDPGSSATINLSAWARANGGFTSTEPVNVIMQLRFERQNGKSFVRQYLQYVPQF